MIFSKGIQKWCVKSDWSRGINRRTYTRYQFVILCPAIFHPHFWEVEKGYIARRSWSIPIFFREERGIHHPTILVQPDFFGVGEVHRQWATVSTTIPYGKWSYKHSKTTVLKRWGGGLKYNSVKFCVTKLFVIIYCTNLIEVVLHFLITDLRIWVPKTIVTYN